MGKALWKLVENEQRFQGAVGAFCASTALSASAWPARVPQDGSQGRETLRDVELYRRVLGLPSTRE